MAGNVIKLFFRIFGFCNFYNSFNNSNLLNFRNDFEPFWTKFLIQRCQKNIIILIIFGLSDYFGLNIKFALYFDSEHFYHNPYLSLNPNCFETSKTHKTDQEYRNVLPERRISFLNVTAFLQKLKKEKNGKVKSFFLFLYKM